MSCSSPAGLQAVSPSERGPSSSPSDAAADPATSTRGCPDGCTLSADEEFFMFQFKVLPCTQTGEHCLEDCPYAHPGEKATRRDPRVLESSTGGVQQWKYSGISCPSYRKGSCKDGDACQYAHGVFEVWLHPSRFRTELCKDGPNCSRKCCFFAHTPEQLRQPPPEDPSVQALAQKAAQRAALASRSTSSSNSSSSSGSSGSMCGLKHASSTASCDSAAAGMLRAGAGASAVRCTCSPANGPGAARRSLPHSRTSTPAHGSCSSLQQLEALSGLSFDAVAPQSRFLLQQQAAPPHGAHGAPLAASSASRTLFDLPPAPSSMAAFGAASAGPAALAHPTPAQLLPASAVGLLHSLAGQGPLGAVCPKGVLAGNHLQPPTSAGLLGLPGACVGSHAGSPAGFAATAALEILAAQQQDLAAACMLQQMLLEAQQQQQMLHQAQHVQASTPQDQIFQMWASAYNAAKAVGLQAHEAAACADCAVEQTVGSLAPPQLAVPTTNAAASAAAAAAVPLLGCAAGGHLVGGPFGAPSHPGAVGCGGGKGPLGALGTGAQLQQAGFQPMLALHSAPDFKQVPAGLGVVTPDVLVGKLTGDVLAGLIPGLSL